MPAELHMSRVRLRSGQDYDRLGPLLCPTGDGRMGASHRMVWSLFPTDADDRPFLYRDATGRGRGEYLVLSRDRPHDALGLFDVETTPFEPRLHQGDRLRFSLRAHATVTRGGDARIGKRGERREIVGDAMDGIPRSERPAARERIVREVGTAWLVKQGESSGFRIDDPDEDLFVEGYNIDTVQAKAGRASRRRRGAFPLGTIDYQGVLTVTDPNLFVERVGTGFGRGRAFGCGLMLIQRH